MTMYTYKCKKCGYEQDFEHDMEIGPALTHKCLKCDGVMMRNYCSSIIIPPHFNETNNSIKYGKTSPSGRKHFWPVNK